MRDPSGQLEDIKARWMTGGTGANACPLEWQEALGDAPDLTLLALTGQFTRLATQVKPNGSLAARANLPALALPTLPHDLRSLLRQVLAQKEPQARAVVALLAERGVTAHPLDWMPKKSDEDLPEVYGPWQDWLLDEAGTSEHDTLTAENWEDWYPQARLAKLREIRAQDPAQGLSLIEAIAPSLAAEPRFNLVRTLETGLSEDDADYLESLESDRSGKIRSLSVQFLARIGRAKANAEAQSELSAFFEVTKAGMLSRQRVIGAVKTKNNAQRKRRTELCQSLPLSALADGLGVSSDDVVELWDFGEASGDMAQMVADTGTPAQNKTFLLRTLENRPGDTSPLQGLARLETADRPDMAAQIIAHDATTFALTAEALAPCPGKLDMQSITKSGAFREFAKLLSKDEDAPTARAITAGLANLGLIASAAAAEGLVTNFTDNGVMAADPRLALLRLNASLKE